MDTLKPCPFCGYRPTTMHYDPYDGYHGDLSVCRIWCLNCKAMIERDTFIKAMVDWNRRQSEIKVETNFFDKEEIYPNCTVQVLTNTTTGEVSVGWWKNEED